MLSSYLQSDLVYPENAAVTGKTVRIYEKSIAVLPFENLINSIEGQYLIDE